MKTKCAILLAAYKRLCRLEGIFPALEASHALAFLEKLCPNLPHGTKVVVNCSGCGDKDAATVQQLDKLLVFTAMVGENNFLNSSPYTVTQAIFHQKNMKIIGKKRPYHNG